MKIFWEKGQNAGIQWRVKMLYIYSHLPLLFQAYKKWVADKGDEKLTPTPHYTNDQDFFLSFAQVSILNPLPDMLISANKDVMSKTWTNGDTIIWLSRKRCGKRRNYSWRAISHFPRNVFKSCLLLIYYQNEYLWSKGLKANMPRF